MIPAPDITIRMGDTLPYVQQYLKSRDGTAFSIPGGTVVEFVFRRYATMDMPTEVTGQIVAPGSNGLVRAQIDPESIDRPGRFQAWWRLTLATDDVVSFPDGDYLWFQVTPE